MKENSFDYHSVDSQGIKVEPLEISKFDIEMYRDYEASFTEKIKNFWNADRGVMVHRRFRVPEVYRGDVRIWSTLCRCSLKLCGKV